MTLNPTALDHRPSADADRGAVFLHGRKRSPGEMRDLAGEIGMLDWRCSFPLAAGGSWYPNPFSRPLAENEPDLGASVERLREEVDRLAMEGIDPARIAIGGFSQGACVVAEYLARGGPRPMAILLFSGALPGPARPVRRPRVNLAGVPAFVSGSRTDPFLPGARVQSTADWLRACGANLHLLMIDDRPHAIDDSEIEAAKSFVEALEAESGPDPDDDQRP